MAINNLQQAIADAVRAHQAGRIDQAEAIYNQILTSHPNQPDALHLLGVVVNSRGDRERALTLIDRAIDAAPKIAEFHVNRGNILKQMGRLEDSLAAYRTALALKPTV